VILDTTAITAWADEWPSVSEILANTSRRVVPIVALGEYEFGIRSSQKRSYYEHWIEHTLLHLCELLPITLATSRIYSPIYHELESTGRHINSHNDVWIGACALQLGLRVLSRDKDLDRINGLVRIDFPDERKRGRPRSVVGV